MHVGPDGLLHSCKAILLDLYNPIKPTYPYEPTNPYQFLMRQLCASQDLSIPVDFIIPAR